MLKDAITGLFLSPAGRGASEEARFWSHVDPCRTDGCALWLGSRTPSGYGSFRPQKVLLRAHQYLIGKAPEGLEWDHKCKVRNCIWPEHLELVTHTENIRRSKQIAFCRQGHAYVGANIYVHPVTGYRHCRLCANEKRRKHR